MRYLLFLVLNVSFILYGQKTAKIKTIFNKNKDYFETAFMTTGIGTVQNLVQ